MEMVGADVALLGNQARACRLHIALAVSGPALKYCIAPGPFPGDSKPCESLLALMGLNHGVGPGAPAIGTHLYPPNTAATRPRYATYLINALFLQLHLSGG